jgi:predicted phage tail protein
MENEELFDDTSTMQDTSTQTVESTEKSTGNKIAGVAMVIAGTGLGIVGAIVGATTTFTMIEVFLGIGTGWLLLALIGVSIALIGVGMYAAFGTLNLKTIAMRAV